METFFWGCFITGILFTIVTLLFGEVLSGWADTLAGHPIAFLQPVVWVGGVTAFGGTGILLLKYSPLGGFLSLVVAGILAVFLSALLWFLYVKPVQRSENSTGFSMKELVGRIGEVVVPIPDRGYGEVMIKVGSGITNQIAAGFEGTAIADGERVVVVEVKEQVLFVTLLEERTHTFVDGKGNTST
ncbi:NfeD family protein [Paenibacillus eucommiae]|uniref:Membrane-bound ClpP family serine protease n=1 Tax=Paenibacillus eucommiae TaxID=1355755 RepID=A0ABS4IP06_9BACL|nr:NfeD family protein [Paenibacillus eucommiae]MBP1989298.1 membrane-bound ClpP family serine protease [Paenibacillus eucommiae]